MVAGLEVARRDAMSGCYKLFSRKTIPSCVALSAAPRLRLNRPSRTQVISTKREFATHRTSHTTFRSPFNRPNHSIKGRGQVSLINGELVYKPTSTDEHEVIPKNWLRDNCQCNGCKHPATKQRLFDIFERSGDNDRPESEPNVAVPSADITETADGFDLTWHDGKQKPHTSTFHKEWLIQSLDKPLDRWASEQALEPVEAWHRTSDGSVIVPEVEYRSVINSDEGVGEWMLQIRRFGYCYVEGCPPTPKATEQLLERISYIRNTHYGAFWDFTSDLSKGDTAYTDLAIGPHTDNTYFTDPAGLQMFHLLSHEDGEGGKSGLFDGFAAATEMLNDEPELYSILANTDVHCHASGNDGISIQPASAYPILCHDPRSGILQQVRWNPADRSAVDLPLKEMDRWYEAARKWSQLVQKHGFEEQLRPGRPLIFDNWRVLHSRTAFTGKRRVCGGYINHDDYISRLKATTRGNERMLYDVSLA